MKWPIYLEDGARSYGDWIIGRKVLGRWSLSLGIVLEIVIAEMLGSDGRSSAVERMG
jgi:hypothetical protein